MFTGLIEDLGTLRELRIGGARTQLTGGGAQCLPA
jgi:riboflavin synthase alpha subunit